MAKLERIENQTAYFDDGATLPIPSWVTVEFRPASPEIEFEPEAKYILRLADSPKNSAMGVIFRIGFIDLRAFKEGMACLRMYYERRQARIAS